LLPRKPPEAALDPDVELDELEHDIEALRLAYDKYFLGIDRAAPVRQRERLDRRFRRLEGGQMRTTVLRFRLSGLRARYVTYAHYWARVLDQIERGVWRRDLARGTPRATSTDASVAEPIAPSPAVEPNGTAAPASAIDPRHARDVFDRLIAAKIAAGEATDGLTFPAFLRKLSREAPKLQEQSGGKPVTLDVEVKAGKVRVRVRSQ
jgi:hypothetical protein